MTSTDGKKMKKIQKQYIAHIAKRRKAGAPILSYDCPSCNVVIETAVPSNKLEMWDTLSTCPFCAGMHFKMARCDAVTAVKL